MTVADRRLPNRILRFGVVGLSGVFINQAVLFAVHDGLLAGWASESRRLDVALAVAIGCATVNNFYWNQRWTWSDRVVAPGWSASLQRFFGYLVASGAAIALQVVLTRWLAAAGVQYLQANLAAIAAGAVVNFTLNHTVTFARHRWGRVSP